MVQNGRFSMGTFSLDRVLKNDDLLQQQTAG